MSENKISEDIDTPENTNNSKKIASKNTFSNFITIIVTSEYLRELKREANDEMEIAIKKWKVDEKNIPKRQILENSFNQLKIKVEETTNIPWDTETKNIIIQVSSQENDKIGNITLKKNTKIKEELKNKNIVFNISKGYITIDPKIKKGVTIEEFYDFFTDSIKKWLRTAVFYGVGSYS